MPPNTQPDRRFVLACACAFALSTGSAAAGGPSQSKDQMARAQALFDEGIRLFNLGRYREACPKFEDSLSLVAGVGTRGKLAECYEKQGKTASAWRLYKEVERLATRSGNELRRKVAAERVRALEPRLARLTVESGPSVVLPGFSIAVNAQPLPPREYGMTRIVDPGNYIIVARAPGYRPWAGSVRLDEGGQDSVRVLALESGRTPKTRAVSYALIGLGALTAVGGGAYFGTRARSMG